MPRESYAHHPRPLLWLVRGGETVLGTDADPARPRRTIEVASFYLSRLPVTNVQFEAFDPAFTRSPLAPADDDPATGVSWTQAAAYAAWYARISRKPMRLPTEDEWEFACRAGTTGTTFWGDDPDGAETHAWDATSGLERVPKLDAKRMNPFGFYAMLGGAWEWVDGGEDEARILRGGSFRTPRAELSSTLRRLAPARREVPDAGFRIARSLR